MNHNAIIAENTRRNDVLYRLLNDYSPLTGEGSISVDRVEFYLPDAPIPLMFLPKRMMNDPFVACLLRAGSMSDFIRNHMQMEVTYESMDQLWLEFEKVRFRYDFEYWAIVCVTIEPKEGGEDIPFRLNLAQRKYLRQLMDMFIAGVPIRIILVKARQWGGSTLTQVFMAWIQIIHKSNWNSVICAHIESTARVIKGMYSKILKSYPARYSPGGQLHFSPYEGSVKTSIINEVNCRVTIGSAEKPDGVRGEHTSMAHLSEVGLWRKTEGKMPEDIVQAVSSGILRRPHTMIIYESTAKGVGNFFHNEWKKAIAGTSKMKPFFISWVDIPELYSLSIPDVWKMVASMNEYELLVWKKTGATLEQIYWYREESKGTEPWRMMSEFPTWADEAFQSTGRMVFKLDDVNRMRMNCEPPEWVGDITGAEPYGKKALTDIKWIPDERGRLKVWAMPDHETRMERRYIVSVDLGGRTSTSDPSAIKVLDRYYMTELGGVPETVAQWKGNIDLDLLIWKATQIAKEYNNALLVIESNTAETKETEGSHGEFILNEIAGVYSNLYSRTSAEKIKGGAPIKYGFHTDSTGGQAKTLLVDTMVRLVREGGYIERDDATCDELAIYEVHEDGTFGNVIGKDNHDDLVMATMIGLFVCYDFQRFGLPAFVIKREPIYLKRVRMASDF